MPKPQHQKEWEFPDYTQATEEERLNSLLALRNNQPEDALSKADRNIPKRKETREAKEQQ